MMDSFGHITVKGIGYNSKGIQFFYPLVVFNALSGVLKPASIVPIDDSRFTKPPEITATYWVHALDIRDIIERFKSEFNLIGYRHLKSREDYEFAFQVLCNSLQFIINLI